MHTLSDCRHRRSEYRRARGPVAPLGLAFAPLGKSGNTSYFNFSISFS